MSVLANNLPLHARQAVRNVAAERAHAAIVLSPRLVLAVLIVLIAAAWLSSTVVQVALIAGEYPIPAHIVRLLDLDQENNLPTWLSSTNLLISSVLAAIITKTKHAQHDHYTLYWFGLFLTLAYLSVDEAASIHEVSIGPVKDIVGETSGAFFAAWVIPALIAVVVFTFLYLRFFLSLPRRILALFVLAGVLYVVGAIGLEMASWHYRHPMFDPDNFEASLDLTYMMINHVEEALEMLGVAVLIYALLVYIDMERISFSMKVSRAP